MMDEEIMKECVECESDINVTVKEYKLNVTIPTGIDTTKENNWKTLWYFDIMVNNNIPVVKTLIAVMLMVH